MEVTNEPVEWDLQEDHEIFRQFLNSRTGKRLIPKILEEVPPLLAKGDVNEILIRSGEVRGWQAAVKALLSLAVPVAPDGDEPVLSRGDYADPADDSKWNDGQRLSFNKTPETPQ